MRYKLPQPINANFFDLPFLGDRTYEVNYVASLDAADSTTVVFYSGKDITSLEQLETGIIIADISLIDEISDQKAKAIVFCDKPKYVFLSMLSTFFNNTF